MQNLLRQKPVGAKGLAQKAWRPPREPATVPVECISFAWTTERDIPKSQTGLDDERLGGSCRPENHSAGNKRLELGRLLSQLDLGHRQPDLHCAARSHSRLRLHLDVRA